MFRMKTETFSYRFSAALNTCQLLQTKNHLTNLAKKLLEFLEIEAGLEIFDNLIKLT